MAFRTENLFRKNTGRREDITVFTLTKGDEAFNDHALIDQSTKYLISGAIALPLSFLPGLPSD